MGPDKAPLTLFLHGITESHRYFKRRVEPLANELHMLIPDLPGFGRSPKPVVPYRVELFVEAVRALLVSQGLADRPLHLVGHSLGAIIAIRYAGCFPEHVNRIVLLNLPRYRDPGAAHRIFWEGSASYRKLVQEQSWSASFRSARRVGLEASVRSLVGMPIEVFADCRLFTFQSLTSTLENCLLNYCVDGDLPALPPRPTLLLHGARDLVAPSGGVAELAAAHAHMRFHLFRSGGHHVIHTHPRRCLALIREHLSGS